MTIPREGSNTIWNHLYAEIIRPGTNVGRKNNKNRKTEGRREPDTLFHVDCF